MSKVCDFLNRSQSMYRHNAIQLLNPCRYFFFGLPEIASIDCRHVEGAKGGGRNTTSIVLCRDIVRKGNRNGCEGWLCELRTQEFPFDCTLCTIATLHWPQCDGSLLYSTTIYDNRICLLPQYISCHPFAQQFVHWPLHHHRFLVRAHIRCMATIW